MLVDDRVLIRCHTEGRALVGDAAQHHVGPLVRVLHQVGGEGGDRGGQCLALGAGRLIATVEEVAQQFRMGGDQPVVEALGDLPEGGADGGEGGAHGGG